MPDPGQLHPDIRGAEQTETESCGRPPSNSSFAQLIELIATPTCTHLR